MIAVADINAGVAVRTIGCLGTYASTEGIVFGLALKEETHGAAFFAVVIVVARFAQPSLAVVAVVSAAIDTITAITIFIASAIAIAVAFVGGH